MHGAIEFMGLCADKGQLERPVVHLLFLNSRVLKYVAHSVRWYVFEGPRSVCRSFISRLWRPPAV